MDTRLRPTRLRPTRLRPTRLRPTRLRIGFAGTPAFALPALATLCATATLAPLVVYTQPDRPAGRGRRPSASPVKRLTQDINAERGATGAVPVALEQPPSLRDPDAQRRLVAYRLDLLVVIAYGLLLPPPVLAAPRLGCLNVHASLLPRWRGAAPIQRAIEAGDRETGISLMRMDAGLDTGPVYEQHRCPIEPTMTAGQLHDRLAELGAARLPQLLTRLAEAAQTGGLRGGLDPTPQHRLPGEPSYAAKLDKAEARLDWWQPATQLARQIRAFNPWPTAFTTLDDGRRLRLLTAHAEAEQSAAQNAAAPGTVVAQTETTLSVVCGTGRLAITRLQLAGRQPLDAGAFNRALRLVGRRLGTDER